jgi:hypothetical protein
MTCPGRGSRAYTVGGKHSRKEPFEKLVYRYSEQLHMSAQPVKNATDMTPFSACAT